MSLLIASLSPFGSVYTDAFAIYGTVQVSLCIRSPPTPMIGSDRMLRVASARICKPVIPCCFASRHRSTTRSREAWRLQPGPSRCAVCLRCLSCSHGLSHARGAPPTDSRCCSNSPAATRRPSLPVPNTPRLQAPRTSPFPRHFIRLRFVLVFDFVTTGVPFSHSLCTSLAWRWSSMHCV